MKRFLFVFVLLFWGCGGGSGLIEITPRVQDRKTYTPNAIRYTRTGNVMIGVARVYMLPTFVALDAQEELDYSRFRANEKLRDNPDLAWLGTHRIHRKHGYVIVKDADASYGLHIRNTGEIGEGWIRLPGGRKARQETGLASDSQFERVSPILLEGSFQAALVYTGKNGSQIQLVYREYLDGSTQPASTQELTYDLDVSPIIVFKSLEIEVIEASDSRIRFKVLEDGGLPWLPAVREK